MKQRLLHIITLSLFFAFTSCSSDDIEISDSDAFGLWDRSEVVANGTKLYRIVFGNNSQAIKIERTDFNDGTAISSANNYEWSLDGNELRITSPNDEVLFFELNIATSPSQLESSNGDILIKISDDVSDFFGN